MAIFDDALGWLGQTIRTVNGECGTIRRGTYETSVTIVRGSNRPRLYTDQGDAYVELSNSDLIIKVSDYVFNGDVAKPLPGDRIELDGDSYVTTPYVSGENCWRYVDAYRNQYRIHVQLDGEV